MSMIVQAFDDSVHSYPNVNIFIVTYEDIRDVLAAVCSRHTVLNCHLNILKLVVKPPMLNIAHAFRTRAPPIHYDSDYDGCLCFGNFTLALADHCLYRGWLEYAQLS